MLLFLTVLLCVLAAGGAYFYFAILRPAPRAHRHVPRGTNLALRADAFALATFKPVREHLWPLFVEARRRDPSEVTKRLERLHAATGVRMPEDLREVIVASVDGKQWVAAIGGPIAPGKFVDGLDTVLREFGVTSWTKDGDLLVSAHGPIVAQADDGTIVVGTAKSVVLAALPARDEEPLPGELPLPIEGAMSFMLTHAAYGGVVAELPLVARGLEAVDQIERVSGTLTLSETPRIDVHLAPRGVPAEKLAAKIEAELGKLKLAMLLAPSDLAGGKQAIRDAKVAVLGDEVHLGAAWPYEPLEQAVMRLAEMLATGLAPAPQRK